MGCKWNGKYTLGSFLIVGWLCFLNPICRCNPWEGDRYVIERGGKHGRLAHSGHGEDKEVRGEGGLMQRSLSLPCLLKQVGRGGCLRNIQIKDAPVFCPEPHSAWRLHYSVGGGIGSMEKPEVWQAGVWTWKCQEGWCTAEAGDSNQEAEGTL